MVRCGRIKKHSICKCMFAEVHEVERFQRSNIVREGRSQSHRVAECKNRRRSDPYRILVGEARYLTYGRWTSSLPSCLWSLRIFPSLPGSRLTIFYRDVSSALLQLVNQWLNFIYSRSHAFRYETKNTNPTLVRIELTTSALAGVQVTYYNRPLGRRVSMGMGNPLVSSRQRPELPVVFAVPLILIIIQNTHTTLFNIILLRTCY